MNMMTEQHNESKVRTSGSSDDFENDWQLALADDSSRYYIYPSHTSGRQADLFEWIKAQQILTLLDACELSEGSFLEYGCGAAGISLYLGGRGYSAHLSDLSHSALDVARRNRLLHAPKIEIASATIANALKLPYADSSFDAVMSYGLLEHFEGELLTQLLTDTIRVIKPGGLFIADIVPGFQRFNARSLGIVVNYAASMFAHFASGKWRRLATLHRLYFDHYFENTLDDRAWAELLKEQGLRDVWVNVCRPFPPLAIDGSMEKLYSGFIRRLLPFHYSFDNANSWFTRRWGWMYLATAQKPIE